MVGLFDGGSHLDPITEAGNLKTSRLFLVTGHSVSPPFPQTDNNNNIRLSVCAYRIDGGPNILFGESVKISQPLLVTPTVCSYWAVKDRSRVTAVQPSERTLTPGLPKLIIGSIVKIIPSFISTPSLGVP